MEIATPPPVTRQSGSPAATPGTSSRVIASDFDTFLKMLTVQMQNQDPLNPVDSSDYAVQLATFSGVEQQVLTNNLLTSLSAQMGQGGMLQMAGWVGKEARAPVAAFFNGSPLTIAPIPAALADRAELVVRDATGLEVQRLQIPVTADPIAWAGVTSSGGPLASGQYTFDVMSYASGELIEEKRADTYGRISEVRIDGTETIIIFDGGAEIPAANVTALRDPA